MTAAATTSVGPVVSMTVTHHQRGPWTAEVVVDGDEELSGSTSITIGDVTYTGTVTESTAFAGRVTASIVGGGGGLGAAVPAQQFVGAPVRLIAGSLAALVGEALAPASMLDSDVADQPVESYAAASQTLGQILDDLCAPHGATWRTIDDGTIWLGVDDWSTSVTDDELDVLEELFHSQIEVADDALRLRPGHVLSYTIGGETRSRRVVAVTHRWGAERARSRVWTAPDGTSISGSLPGLITRVVEQRMPDPIYHQIHAARVQSQSSDGTLQVYPDDSRVPPMVGVPFRGTPGIRVTFKRGARVRVGFEGGDPRCPFAMAANDSVDGVDTIEIESGATTKIKGDVELGNSAANPIATVGSVVQVTLPVLVAGPPPGALPVTDAATGAGATPATPITAVGIVVGGPTGVRA